MDQPARIVRIERPEYPPALRERNICGWADLSYIIDTTGRAEPGSLTVLRATDSAFGRSAVEAIRDAAFSPATRRGLVVRQRISQRISFNLASLQLGECRGGA